MEAKIIMTSPYPQMTNKIKTISEQLGIPVKIVEATMSDAAEKVKKEIENNPSIEVIISRSGTYEEISRKNIKKPLIHADNSDFELLEAFWNAKKIGNEIAFLAYQDLRYPYKIEKLNEIMGFKIHLYPYRTWNELEEQIEKAYNNNIDVIVGGGTRAMALISEKGMRGMHITTSSRTITRIILRANEVAEYRMESREKVELLNSIMNISDESIIVTNKLGNIIYFNHIAEKILNIQAEQIIGLKNEEVLSIDSLYRILNSSSKQILKIAGWDYVVESLTIENDSNSIGKIFTLKEVNKIQQLETVIRKEIYQKGLIAKYSLDDIIHSDSKMKKVILQAKKYAETESTILITGESGTGKELFAQGIHKKSLRKDGPFVAINCASISDSLLESELFGYEEGAFTGAKKGGKAGVFEIAHGGTIFLDEIGDISPKIQAILLRVLQEKEIMRVGGDRVLPINVRVIAATNQPLWDKVQNGSFRKDLYFRLNVLRLQLPPLRERREDILILANHLLKNHNITFSQWGHFPQKLQEFFLEYDWPGNIRQLENVVERLALDMNTFRTPRDLIEEIMTENNVTEPINIDQINEIKQINTDNKNQISISSGTMEEMEKQIIEHLLNVHGNNRGLIAKKLGVSRTTLWKKLKTLDTEYKVEGE